jgi:hypothetical protein
MPGPRNRTGTDPSLNHPLTMSYMGAGSGWEKGWDAAIFTLPCRGRVAAPEGRAVGSTSMRGSADRAETKSERSLSRRFEARQFRLEIEA